MAARAFGVPSGWREIEHRRVGMVRREVADHPHRAPRDPPRRAHRRHRRRLHVERADTVVDERGHPLRVDQELVGARDDAVDLALERRRVVARAAAAVDRGRRAQDLADAGVADPARDPDDEHVVHVERRRAARWSRAVASASPCRSGAPRPRPRRRCPRAPRGRPRRATRQPIVFTTGASSLGMGASTPTRRTVPSIAAASRICPAGARPLLDGPPCRATMARWRRGATATGTRPTSRRAASRMRIVGMPRPDRRPVSPRRPPPVRSAGAARAATHRSRAAHAAPPTSRDPTTYDHRARRRRAAGTVAALTAADFDGRPHVPARPREDRRTVPARPAVRPPRHHREHARVGRSDSGSGSSTPAASRCRTRRWRSGTATRPATTPRSTTAAAGRTRRPGPRSCAAPSRPTADGIVEFATHLPRLVPGPRRAHPPARPPRRRRPCSPRSCSSPTTTPTPCTRPRRTRGSATPDTTNAQDAIAGDPEAEGTMLRGARRRHRPGLGHARAPQPRRRGLMDLTQAATPGYFATMAIEHQVLKRRRASASARPPPTTSATTPGRRSGWACSASSRRSWPPRCSRRSSPGGAATARRCSPPRSARPRSPPWPTASPPPRVRAVGRRPRPGRHAARASGGGPGRWPRSARRWRSRPAAWRSPPRGCRSSTSATMWPRRLVRDLGTGPVALGAAILGWDFIYYWNHRFMHTQPVHVGDPRGAPLERAVQPLDRAASARRRRARHLRAVRAAVPRRVSGRRSSRRRAASTSSTSTGSTPTRSRSSDRSRRCSTPRRTTACTTGRTVSTWTATTAAS